MEETHTEFHKYFSNYYIRGDNQITFKNGMALNEISLAMWEILGFKDMDPSFLSRVINGKRLFSDKHLDAFFRIIKIPYKEQKMLRSILLKDRMKMLGLKDDLTSAKVDLDFAKGMLDTIWMAQKQDKIDISIKLSDALNIWMDDKVHISPYKSEFINIYAKSLISMQFNYGTIISPPEIIKLAKKNFRKLSAVMGRNENAIGMGYFFIGDSNYILKDYRTSLYWNKKALPLISDQEFRLRILRDQALNYAYLGLVDEFLAARSEIYICMDKLKRVGTIDFQAFICHIYEALARSESLLGMESALSTITIAINIMQDNLSNRNVNVGIGKVLVARSMLEIVTRLYPTDKTNIERLALKGISEANKHNYKRYAATMENLLQKSYL